MSPFSLFSVSVRQVGKMAQKEEGEEKFVTGASLLASALKCQGVEYMFGIVGRRIVELVRAAQPEGIKFIAMRNEQAVRITMGEEGWEAVELSR